MTRLTIDGVEIEARDGVTILEAADAAGIYIPRLCAHPDLPVIDSSTLEPWEKIFQGTVSRSSARSTDSAHEGCRLCLVKLDGQTEPVRACVTRVEEGVEIATSSAEIESLRRGKLRELFSTHPHACVQCGQRAGCALEPCSTGVAVEERCCAIFHNCELRKVAEYVGIPEDTPRYRPAGFPLVDGEPLFLRDHNLCIGCLRCVRMCRDVRKVDALGFVLDERGEPVIGTKAPTLWESGCIFCLSCVEVCPTGAFRLKSADPRQDGERLTQCVAGCPAGMDVPRYLREIRRGEFARAEAVIREVAPLPRILGQVCFHPCEAGCLRGELSQPIAICALKRAALDHTDEPIWKSRLEPGPSTGKSVAVVGAGPAGLTAAWFLRLKGHEVVLYDSQPAPGGWLRDGIPRYRLSSAALDADIEDILALGIRLEMGVEVGKHVTLEGVRSDHDAVFIAAGARGAVRLPCEGADLLQVESGLELLQRLSEDDGTVEPRFAGETVVVTGGGDVAIDVARTALRLSAREVHLYCLEERDAMPAHEQEVAEAEREGVVMHPGWGTALIAGAEAVERVDFHKCTSVLDNDGKFAPKFDESVSVTQRADRMLVAIGQEPALAFLAGVDITVPSPGGTIEVNVDTMCASTEGVFAGGDVVSGPASVIAAIAHGRRAASGIDLYLGGNGNVYVPLLDETESEVGVGEIEGFTDLERASMPQLSVSEALEGFSVVELGYPQAVAMREANRCLRCDLRLSVHSVPEPPDAWLAFTEENVALVPESAGVFRLLDDSKDVYAIAGVQSLRSALLEMLSSSSQARFFLFEEDPMYSKRESELIQEYLRVHGRMPPGEGDDDLDDLF